MSNDVEMITETFHNFMVEMNQWETNANLRSEKCERIPFDEFQKELKVIKAKYLTDKACKYEKTSFGYPPEYTPELEQITEIEIKGNTATVKTDRKYSILQKIRLYKWKKVDGVWRLDNAKERGLEDDIWSKVFL